MVYLGYTTLAEQLSVDLGDIVIGLKNLYNRNIMIKKLIFNVAKKQFRKALKTHKASVRANKKSKGLTPIMDYGLLKNKVKRDIRSTKFMDKAAYKAAPKTNSLP